jgi:hypothetical protein
MPVESSHPHGEVFLDARGQGRALRLTWHHEADVVVLSLWRDRICAGTFRLTKADVNDFVDALIDGLRDTPADPDAAAGLPPVVPYTGAIDVTPPVAAAKHVRTEDEGFVEWALREGEGRATA